MISLRIAQCVKHLDRSSSLTRLTAPHWLTALTVRNRSFRSGKKEEEVEPEVDPDKPIKFSTSKAAHWTVEEARGPLLADRAPFERTIVYGSIIVFMIYFCIYREENDIDEMIGLTLQERLAYSQVQLEAKKAK